jgi:hypothetical protein
LLRPSRFVSQINPFSEREEHIKRKGCTKRLQCRVGSYPAAITDLANVDVASSALSITSLRSLANPYLATVNIASNKTARHSADESEQRLSAFSNLPPQERTHVSFPFRKGMNRTMVRRRDNLTSFRRIGAQSRTQRSNRVRI